VRRKIHSAQTVPLPGLSLPSPGKPAANWKGDVSLRLIRVSSPLPWREQAQPAIADINSA
jgi:hypothetical protein